MKYSPLLFTGEMVRAILEGRKTQTRRLVKPQPFHAVVEGTTLNDEGRIYLAPLGAPGDRIWVKETFRDCSKDTANRQWEYRADESKIDADMHPVKWKPSIFMPRAASRITLELTAVRVDRLQDISEADAKAEGVEPVLLSAAEWVSDEPVATTTIARCKCIYDPHRTAYARLWEKINGVGQWDQNPWVWVYEFKRV